MTHTLLVYDRATGDLLVDREYDRSEEALQARFDAEEHYQGSRGEIEVVVLNASSRKELERTHSRYFRSLQQLAKQGA